MLDKHWSDRQFFAMITKIVTIRLTDELDDFAMTDMEACGIANFSGYVRYLLRQRRKQIIREDVALLREAMKDAPVGDPPADFMRAMARVRRSFRRRQREGDSEKQKTSKSKR